MRMIYSIIISGAIMGNVALAQTNHPELEITLKHNDQKEQQTKQQLEQLPPTSEAGVASPSILPEIKPQTTGLLLSGSILPAPTVAEHKQEITPVVNREYLPALLPLIEGAKKNIDFIHLEFHYDPDVKKVQDSLRAAVARGVHVRGLLDNNMEFNKTSVGFLNKYGIDAKLDTPNKITHNKLFIIDRQIILLGSTNLSQHSMEQNNETNVLIKDELLGGYFSDYFEKLWEDSGKEPAMESFTSGRVTALTSGSYFNEASTLLADAKGEIKIIMYSMSRDRKNKEAKVNKLLDALIDAGKRGVKVKVLLDQTYGSEINNKISKVNTLVGAYMERRGVEVRYDDEKTMTHAKLVCVDGAVLVGSYNWRFTPLESRNECAVIVKDKATSDFFNKYFDTLWAESRGIQSAADGIVQSVKSDSAQSNQQFGESKSENQGARTTHEVIKERQRKIAEPYAECKPSEVTETPWIYALRKVGSYPKVTEQSGKWLIFVPDEKLDATWAVIKEATEAGKLGDSSKVATMYPNPNKEASGKRVICVYTYDWTDKADVHRVRQALRELGFDSKLPYKTDQDSLDGKYQSKGFTHISKYYE